MCEPVSATTATVLMYTAIAGTVAATGVAAYSAYQQGKAAEYEADFQAKQAENNATIAGYQAQDAARRGEEEAKAVQRAYAQRIAAGRAGFAAGNVALDSGSAGLWQVGSEVSRAEDLATVRSNTDLDVWGLQYQGQSLRSQAGALRIGGDNAYRAGVTSAAGSLLSGAGTAAGQYYMFSSGPYAQRTAAGVGTPSSYRNASFFNSYAQP